MHQSCELKWLNSKIPLHQNYPLQQLNRIFYDRSSVQRSFKVNDPVWLSIPTAGKLDLKWEGEWKVVSIKSPVNVEISNGKQTKAVHINRLQHRILPSSGSTSPPVSEPVIAPWCPPQVEHFVELDTDTPQLHNFNNHSVIGDLPTTIVQMLEDELNGGCICSLNT